MKPRDRYRRLRAFARAGHKAFQRFDATGSLGDRAHELHAWERLPEHVKAAVRSPLEFRS